MTRKLTYAILGALMLAAATAQAQGRLTVRAQTDSTVLVMGDQTKVNVEVVKNGHEGTLLDVPEREQDYYGLELVDCQIDSAELSNDRVQLNYRMTFQAFYPAELLTLPPFRYVQQGDTAQSEALTFKVYPVELSPELGNIESVDSLTIHPDEAPIVIPARWYDFLPDMPQWLSYWWVWAIAALVIGILATVLLLYRKNGPSLLPPRKPTPPYELAMQELAALRQRRLLERGEAQLFYTEVVDILRRYLQGRFGINAMEMTSAQIVSSVRDRQETMMSASQIEQTLQVADIVKFAAQHPTQDEAQRAYNVIKDFVEMTKPQPESADADTPDDTNNTKTD